MYHTPVLLNETIEGLNINPNGYYADCTFGGGGHSRAIMERLGENGRLIAFDQDADAKNNIIDDPRFIFVGENFKYLKNFTRVHHLFPLDGILADLGVSSHQFDDPSRGFSTRFNSEIDLRMDSRNENKATTILNTYSLDQLQTLFANYGEVHNAHKLATTIIKSRTDTPITTTFDFKERIAPCVPRGKENKYFAQVFQALRIEVNDELGALKNLLIQSAEMLKEGGRLVVISYHSLEDRLVKNYIKAGNFEGNIEKDFFGNPLTPMQAVSRKAIMPSAEELEQNPRSRSAKLRIAEKKGVVK